MSDWRFTVRGPEIEIKGTVRGGTEADELVETIALWAKAEKAIVAVSVLPSEDPVVEAPREEANE